MEADAAFKKVRFAYDSEHNFKSIWLVWEVSILLSWSHKIRFPAIEADVLHDLCSGGEYWCASSIQEISPKKFRTDLCLLYLYKRTRM